MQEFASELWDRRSEACPRRAGFDVSRQVVAVSQSNSEGPSRMPEQRPPGPNSTIIVLAWIAAGVLILVTLLFYIGYYVGEVGQ
jgi:hypothetical protein